MSRRCCGSLTLVCPLPQTILSRVRAQDMRRSIYRFSPPTVFSSSSLIGIGSDRWIDRSVIAPGHISSKRCWDRSSWPGLTPGPGHTNWQLMHRPKGNRDSWGYMWSVLEAPDVSTRIQIIRSLRIPTKENTSVNICFVDQKCKSYRRSPYLHSRIKISDQWFLFSIIVGAQNNCPRSGLVPPL